ncbi:MAG: prepilin peptidase [Candidatus Omnitrophica bacterium]|nr:prepilin peptidase [Candidatus Omnitrophota bacterium]
MDIFVIFMAGSIVGSFLNVCIVRLPQAKSVVFPSSHCPRCQKPIAWYDNIPLVSWIVLGGRCRRCKTTIDFRYWLVEFLTASFFAVFYLTYGFNPLLPAYLVMICCFMVATFVDLEHRIIPDEVSIGGLWAGLILSAFIPQLHPSSENLVLGGFIAGFLVVLCLLLSWIYPFFCKHLMEEEPYNDKPFKILVLLSLLFIAFVNNFMFIPPPGIASLAAALIGFIIGAGAIYAMGLLGDILFRKESMGGGDVKLMAMIGAFLGWKTALLSFFIAPFFGAIVGIIEKIRTKDSTIAYGPFLVLGALVSLFWGRAIIQWVIQGGVYRL